MFRTQGTMLSLDSFRHTIDNYWISLLLVWNSAYWSKTLLFNKSLSKKFDDQKSSGISVPIANACCFIVYHIHLLFWYFCMNSVYIIFRFMISSSWLENLYGCWSAKFLFCIVNTEWIIYLIVCLFILIKNWIVKSDFFFV